MNANANAQRTNFDRRFYTWAIVVIATIVFAGFARSYYLRPFFRPTGISLLLHFHGIVMTSWLVLFFVQARLIAAHRSDLHRRLGIFGAVLAGLVVLVGCTVLVRAVARHADIHSLLFLQLLVAFDGINLLMFAGLVASAIVLRRRSDFHKRLMLLATLSLLSPAVGRITEIFIPQGYELTILLLVDTCVLIGVAIDTLRQRRVHPAFAWGATIVIASSVITYIAQTNT